MLKKKIKLLMDLIEGSEINQIEISSFWGAQKIKLIKSLNPSFASEAQSQSNTINTEPAAETSNPETIKPIHENEKVTVTPSDHEDKSTTFNAPLVGTFYLSPNPESDSFVKVGDKIKIGDTLCIIEAMKIFNEIKVEDSNSCGEIIEILVDDKTPIEYNQPLFKIKPD